MCSAWRVLLKKRVELFDFDEFGKIAGTSIGPVPQLFGFWIGVTKPRILHLLIVLSHFLLRLTELLLSKPV